MEKYPSLLTRTQSTFIDLILIIVLMISFSIILDQFPQTPDWLRIILFIFLFVAYEPLFTALGATAGNYVMGIRVRKIHDTRKRINIFQAVLRFLLKLTMGWLSYVTIHTNSERRAIHDLSVGSVMIKIQALKDLERQTSNDLIA